MKDKAYYEKLDKRTAEYKDWKASQKKGLGDIVEDITKATGIKKVVGDCEGCEERKRQLNKLTDKFRGLFKNRNDFTGDEIEQWEQFQIRDDKNTVSKEHQKMIVNLLKNVLNMSVKPCNGCSPSTWIKYIDMLDAAYEKQTKL